MLTIACYTEPPSASASKVRGKTARLAAALAAEMARVDTPSLGGLLTGIVFWFVSDYDLARDPDADNISKPVWDILCRRKPGDAPDRPRLGLYDDDRQVRLRTAAILDVTHDGLNARDIDFSDLPPHIVSQIDGLIADESGRRRSLVVVQVRPLRLDDFETAFGEQ